MLVGGGSPGPCRAARCPRRRGHVGRGLDRDSAVGVVQRDRVVDPVAHEADVRAELVLRLDQPRLRPRLPGRRSSSGGSRAASCSSSSLPAGPRAVREHLDSMSEQTFFATVTLLEVAGDHLHLDAEALQRGDGLARVRLRGIEEREKTGVAEAPPCPRCQLRWTIDRARRDRDDPLPGEQPVKVLCAVQEAQRDVPSALPGRP